MSEHIEKEPKKWVLSDMFIVEWSVRSRRSLCFVARVTIGEDPSLRVRAARVHAVPCVVVTRGATVIAGATVRRVATAGREATAARQAIATLAATVALRAVLVPDRVVEGDIRLFVTNTPIKRRHRKPLSAYDACGASSSPPPRARSPWRRQQQP